MGERVQAFTADMTREQHARAIAHFEAMAEVYLEDLEKGATCDVQIGAHARGEGGWLPRGVALYNDAPTVIAGLVAEIRRRDDLLARAVDAIEGHGSYESCASCVSLLADVRAMLCPVEPPAPAQSTADELTPFREDEVSRGG
jgi:hypothetical protein